jgi:hypothetical protein
MIKPVLLFATLTLALTSVSLTQTLSSIEAGENPYFRTLDRKRLDHVIVNLYLGSAGSWHSYHPFVLYPKMGTTQIDDEVLTHHMSDDLIFYDNYRPTRVDHHIELEIERIEGQKIKGYVSYRSNSRGTRGKRSFLLKKTVCR